MLQYNLGNEDENIEFKEVCLTEYLIKYYTENELKDFILYNKKLDTILFNKMMMEIVNMYLCKYVPKYGSIFSNSNIYGLLYLGVSDNGTIEGIPFYDSPNIELIKLMFRASLKLMRSRNELYLQEYISEITFEIIELKENDVLTLQDNIKSSFETLNELITYNNRLERKWEKYKHDNLIWNRTLLLYSGKLINYLLIPELETELKNFIIREFKKNAKLEQRKLAYILDTIETIKKQEIYINFQESVKDKYNIFYWIAKLKDIKVREIKKRKPKHPMYRPMKNIYLHFANNMRNSRAYFQQDTRIKFYLIKIKYPKKEIEERIEYMSDGVNWKHKKRIMTSLGPSCI
jgi:hypothetical protein